MLKIEFIKIRHTNNLKKILNIKYNEPYFIKDADQVLRDIVEASKFENEENGDEYAIIDFNVVNITTKNTKEIKTVSYEMRDYRVQDNTNEFFEIIRSDLETKVIDKDEYDQGLSDPDEESKQFLEEFKKSKDVIVEQKESSVELTRKNKPNLLFNKFWKKKKTEKDSVNEENTINKNKVDLEDVPLGAEFDTKDTETNEFDNKDVQNNNYIDKDMYENTNENQSPNHSETEDNQNIDSNQKEDSNVEADYTQNSNHQLYNKQSIEENSKKDHQLVEENETEDHQNTDSNQDLNEYNTDRKGNVNIPYFKEKKPNFSITTNEFKSSEFVEWLNLYEIKKTEFYNKRVIQLNNQLNSLYMDTLKKNKEKLKEYHDNNFPKDADLEQDREKFKNDSLEEMKEYRQNKENYYDELNISKEQAITDDIENYKQQKLRELEEFKANNEKIKLKEIEEKNNQLQAKYISILDNKFNKLISGFTNQKEKYALDLEQELIDSINQLYEEYKETAFEDIQEYESEIENKLAEIKEKINKEYIERETIEKDRKEKELKMIEEENRQKALTIEEKKIEREIEKPKLLELQNEEKRIEQEKFNNTLKERELELKEKKQKDLHEERLKEIELKYNSAKSDSNSISTDSKKNVVEKKAFNNIKQNILSVLLGILAIVLIVTLMLQSDNHEQKQDKLSYQTYLDNSNYEEIVEHYPKKIESLSIKQYKDNDVEGLKELSKYTDNSIVDMRHQLLTGDDDEIIESFEAMDNPEVLTKDELKKIAEIYLLNQDFKAVNDMNKKINDFELKKQVAEMKYYQQMKKDLIKTIKESKNDEEVNAAKKELEQIEYIIEEKQQ